MSLDMIFGTKRRTNGSYELFRIKFQFLFVVVTNACSQEISHDNSMTQSDRLRFAVDAIVNDKQILSKNVLREIFRFCH